MLIKNYSVIDNNYGFCYWLVEQYDLRWESFGVSSA